MLEMPEMFEVLEMLEVLERLELEVVCVVDEKEVDRGEELELI
jgi:hypothetical protein